MTARTPIETTILKSTDTAMLDWNQVCDQLAAPPPPDTPGGHIPSVLGTAGPDCRPYLTRVGVRWYDGDLYFLSGPTTRKSRNLAASAACSIAMHLEEFDLVFDGKAVPTWDPHHPRGRRRSGPPIRLAGRAHRGRVHRAVRTAGRRSALAALSLHVPHGHRPGRARRNPLAIPELTSAESEQPRGMQRSPGLSPKHRLRTPKPRASCPGNRSSTRRQVHWIGPRSHCRAWSRSG